MFNFGVITFWWIKQNIFYCVKGQSHSGGGGAGGEKKDDKDKKKKYEPPIPTRVGKKRKRAKGPDTATKLPISMFYGQ